METIDNISIGNIRVPHVRPWLIREPVIYNIHPPVVTEIGNPILQMPGCVKMHKDNRKHVNGLPIDKNLIENDPNGVMTVCDAEYPSYDAMNYEPERLIITREAPIPDVQPPETPPTPDVPNTGDLSSDEEVPCPGPAQLRVGDTTQSGDEKVIGHELSEDGKVCVTLYEPTTITQKFLPSINQTTSVTALAVVATAGAAATPLLIRVIRPVIKKLWATVQKKLGKTIYKPTLNEIKTNQYRQSKGLNPLNFEKMKKKG